MPSVSQAQNRYMHMAASTKGRAKLKSEGHKPPPESVAKEFVSADASRKIGKLAQHARKKES
jgi:hypothetical protein